MKYESNRNREEQNRRPAAAPTKQKKNDKGIRQDRRPAAAPTKH